MVSICNNPWLKTWTPCTHIVIVSVEMGLSPWCSFIHAMSVARCPAGCVDTVPPVPVGCVGTVVIRTVRIKSMKESFMIGGWGHANTISSVAYMRMTGCEIARGK